MSNKEAFARISVEGYTDDIFPDQFFLRFTVSDPMGKIKDYTRTMDIQDIFYGFHAAFVLAEKALRDELERQLEIKIEKWKPT